MSDDADDKSPNKDIDTALKELMKQVKGGKNVEMLSPDEVKSKVSILAIAVKWMQVKHNIKDGEDWNPDSI